MDKKNEYLLTFTTSIQDLGDEYMLTLKIDKQDTQTLFKTFNKSSSDNEDDEFFNSSIKFGKFKNYDIKTCDCVEFSYDRNVIFIKGRSDEPMYCQDSKYYPNLEKAKLVQKEITDALRDFQISAHKIAHQKGLI